MKIKNNRINFLKKNFLTYNFKNQNTKFDLILSDLAPNTTGHKSTDHLKISQMIFEIINILDSTIKNKGWFIFKIWKGEEEKEIIKKLKLVFNKVEYFKPKSSRQESSEIFIIAKEYTVYE